MVRCTFQLHSHFIHAHLDIDVVEVFSDDDEPQKDLYEGEYYDEDVDENSQLDSLAILVFFRLTYLRPRSRFRGGAL